MTSDCVMCVNEKNITSKTRIPRILAPPLAKPALWDWTQHKHRMRVGDLDPPSIVVSKKISYILRHGNRFLDVSFDKEGWLSAQDLLATMVESYEPTSVEKLLEFLRESNEEKARWGKILARMSGMSSIFDCVPASVKLFRCFGDMGRAICRGVGDGCSGLGVLSHQCSPNIWQRFFPTPPRRWPTASTGKVCAPSRFFRAAVFVVRALANSAPVTATPSPDNAARAFVLLTPPAITPAR